MNDNLNVHGIITSGGGITNVTQSGVGYCPVVNNSSPASEREPDERRHGKGCDVGIITVLSEETNAICQALQLWKSVDGRPNMHEGVVNAGGRPIRLAAIQALGQGQRSAVAACINLFQEYDPGIIALVGIGGGIHDDVRLGDVVVATRVVYYDLRKQIPGHTMRRGEEREAPAEVGHAINSFFADHHPAEFSVGTPGGIRRPMRMRFGPVGSGDAVIADRDSEILKYLVSFNDKILAVDMESAGLSQACHEWSATSGRQHGWVVVRGISDDAGTRKNDDYHLIASQHAAIAFGKLLPYL